MQDIEPFHKWRDYYVAEEDKLSPFYRRKYSEFYYTNAIYNYLIHPQWDFVGSEALYVKILFVDYDEQCAIIELLGEWNDCVVNDILTLRKSVLNRLGERGICKFIFIGENLLNFHADDDDSYYEEWLEDLRENDGWVVCLNFSEHVMEEMHSGRLHWYLHFGEHYNELEWRRYKPLLLIGKVEELLGTEPKRLGS